MPTVSGKQHRAMEAAAHGWSTLGIPKKVGKEFVAADATAGIAAGIVYVAPDGHILLLKRAGEEGKDNFVGHWALPGGKAETGESPEDAADREAAEELGNTAPGGPKRLLDKRSTPNGMIFHTFAQNVADKFSPKINEEHSEFGWFAPNELPAPMHPAVQAVLENGLAEDNQPAMATVPNSGSLAGAVERIKRKALARDEWKEGDHPREQDGKFGSGGGGSSKKPTLSMKKLRKVSGKLGSNEGGQYTNEAGESFYVKKPATKAHVTNERTAAKLYHLAGVNTLDYRDVEGGEHVATAWQKLEKKNISQFTPAERKEAAKDFAIHAWLSNWDAAGTGGDNQGVLNGKVTTLDVGGSLRFRAQGGPKGGTFGNKVSEWDTMRDKGMSPDAAALFAPMTKNELRASVERVSAIPDDKIRETVGDDKELADRLIARKKDLASKVGLAMDQALELAFDRVMVMSVTRPGLAFDRRPDSVRTVDADGRMHVEISNISKATVNPYVGKEIPRCKDLGLDPDKIYKLLRHPDELRKGAATFNNLPLLDEHVGVNAEDHKPDHVIGSTGTDAAFDGTYLKNSLVVWASRGIKAIESKRKKELSSAYRYRADMTPGTHNGERYDGVMRDIVGNHVALVEEGRAGSDVVVGDSSNPETKQRTFAMKTKNLLSRRGTVAYGALMTYLAPQLAMDAKIDIAAPLRGVTGSNFKARRPKIVSALEKLLEGKLADGLAMDGSIKAGLDAVLDMIEGMPAAEDEFPDPKKAEDEEADEDADMAGDEDETEEEKAAREKKEKTAKDKKAKDAKKAADKKAADKAARDAAKKDVNEEDEEHDPDAMDESEEDKAMDTNKRIETAIAKERDRMEAIRKAENHVRPRVGNLNMAFDSGAEVYRKALSMLGKDVAKLKNADLDTLQFVYDSIPTEKPGQRSTTIAMDAAPKNTLTERLPTVAKNLARIGRA